MKHTLFSISKEVRKHILSMCHRAQSAHVGGSLSCADILVTLYFGSMRIFPKRPYAPERDRLVYSKAHDAMALYATLATRGFFPLSWLKEYEQDKGRLPGHTTRHSVPGVEVSAGSLGHGLPMAAGIAYALKKRERTGSRKMSPRVFVMLSDGECQEGSTWEAILFAAHHKLDNMIAIVDYNKLQGYGYIKDILGLEPFAQKWKSFGWEAKEVNGHDILELQKIFSRVPFKKHKPSVVIAHTVKGYRGVTEHEGKRSSQYVPVRDEELASVLEQVDRL